MLRGFTRFPRMFSKEAFLGGSLCGLQEIGVKFPFLPHVIPSRSACTCMGSPSPVHGSVLSPSPINGQSLPLQPLVTSDGHFSLYGFSYSGL